MKSTFFTFTFEEYGVEYTAEVEVLFLESGNTRLGDYTVFDKHNQYVLMDIPDNVLEDEYQIWLSTV